MAVALAGEQPFSSMGALVINLIDSTSSRASRSPICDWRLLWSLQERPLNTRLSQLITLFFSHRVTVSASLKLVVFLCVSSQPR